MKVLSLSTDQKIFEDGSAVRARQEAYAQHIGEMYIIVLAGGSVPREVVFGTVRAVTTTGPRILAGFAAWLIARRIEKPDVVTVQDPFENGLAAWWIARSLGVPLHVQIHTDFTARGFRRHSLRNRLRTYIAWYVLRRASRVRVVLDRTRDDLVRHGITAPVSVLPIYVDVGRLAQLPREKHPKWKIDFLFIGRLEPEKHPCLAIDVLRAAHEAGHDVGLTVVGEGSEHALLAERARRYSLSTRVEFVGWQHDTARYLSRADLVLVPSRYEGYGMVIVEALAAGVPVVATDVGVAREAGAIVSSERHFARDVLAWVAHGPRQGDLQNYPYSTFDEYVERWCADVRATTL